MEGLRSGCLLFILGLLVGFVLGVVLSNSPLDRERVPQHAHKLEVQHLRSRISELEQQVEKLEKARDTKP
jgi:hypothetical protein